MEKISRKCEICNQSFKPMTDKQWKHVRELMHPLSERHKFSLSQQYKLKNQSASN